MSQAKHRLHHEELDVYQAAIEFLAIAVKLWEKWPRGYGSLIDQFKRAAISIPLNIAEGYGKRSRKDQARYYHIARGSACVCGAVLDTSKVLKLAPDTTFIEAKTLLFRIVSMLVRLAES